MLAAPPPTKKRNRHNGASENTSDLLIINPEKSTTVTVENNNSNGKTLDPIDVSASKGSNDLNQNQNQNQNQNINFIKDQLFPMRESAVKVSTSKTDSKVDISNSNSEAILFTAPTAHKGKIGLYESDDSYTSGSFATTNKFLIEQTSKENIFHLEPVENSRSSSQDLSKKDKKSREKTSKKEDVKDVKVHRTNSVSGKNKDGESSSKSKEQKSVEKSESKTDRKLKTENKTENKTDKTDKKKLVIKQNLIKKRKEIR